jgi:hypothetical protein
LTVEAFLMEGDFPHVEKVLKREPDGLALQAHQTFPNWNYTLAPREDEAGTGAMTGPPGPAQRGR